MANPAAGFPQMFGDDSELEGLYRFLRNENVDADDILEPHINATFTRMRQVEGFCLIAHDTTDFVFGGLRKRPGLGVVQEQQQGFLGHFALAVIPGEERLPLGICGLQRLVRDKVKGSRDRSWWDMAKDPTRESLRWLELVQEIEDKRSGFECIHLMDREGDNYDLFALLKQLKTRFVIRACHDRALVDEARLLPHLQASEPVAHRTITLSERLKGRDRTGRQNKKPPRRKGRAASVAISACTAELRRPKSAHVDERTLKLNVVRVWEPSPPKDQPGVSWILYTTEPIDTVEDILQIVDYYRSRWVIEEFFKALKTGCSIEKRQLESYRALSNALSMLIPIAWRLLLARSIVKFAPDLSSQAVVDSVELSLLSHRLQLKAPPATAKESLYAVAKLGGHLRRNGDPGWMTLGRGFEALLLMKVGWLAAQSAQKRSDQS